MPVMSGLEMIKKIREEDSYIPIIVASGVADPKNIEKGYKLEIDSLIKKPFLPGELDYCIKSIFLRIEKTEKIKRDENKIFQLGSYQFDLKNHCLKSGDNKKNLTTREAQILQVLCEGKGDVVEREDILNQFWGRNDFYTSRCLDVFIAKLRKYFEKEKSVEIFTERGEGYKLILH